MGSLLLIRHGRAEGNGQHRFLGWLDAPLDGAGRAQAERLALRLQGAGITRIVTSDLARAAATAAPLSARLGLEPQPEQGLREIANGEWTGLTPTEIAAGWPELFGEYAAGADVLRPGGEQWAMVRERVVATLERLSADTEGVTAVFTHAGPVLLGAAWALGLSLPGNIFRGQLAAPENTSVTTVAIPGPTLLGYNDVGHLDGLPRLDVPYAPAPAPGR